MNNRTFKVIVILVGLLFLNIEAAQAGLIHKFKAIIMHELSDYQLIYISMGFAACGFLLYVMLTPVSIGNQKSVWLDYFPNNPNKSQFQNKKDLVKRISVILNNPSGL
jgi:hypothetical protein